LAVTAAGDKKTAKREDTGSWATSLPLAAMRINAALPKQPL
jgi:hypothetical protein